MLLMAAIVEAILVIRMHDVRIHVLVVCHRIANHLRIVVAAACELIIARARLRIALLWIVIKCHDVCGAVGRVYFLFGCGTIRLFFCSSFV